MSHPSVSRRCVALISTILLVSLVCFAAKQFVLPTPKAAESYPAHDAHSSEGVAVGLDPYDMADKAAIFSVHYMDEGFLPIFVVITNNGDQPISLTNVAAQFVTVDRSKINRATEDDLYRRLAHPSASGKANPLPWPKKVKGAVSQQAQDEISRSQFAAKAVEPHSTQSGFMFFDISGISTPLAGATFFLTGVNDSKGNELMYFEIPLEKYLSAPSKPN